MNRPSCLFAATVLLLLTACSGGSGTRTAPSHGRDLCLRYAENLRLTDCDGYSVATIRNPWDTLKTLHTYVLVDTGLPVPQDLPTRATVVRTPLSHSVVYSSVHCSLLEQLHALRAIAGVCDLSYIKLQSIHDGCSEGRITDCGNGMEPDMERLIELHPDALLLSPFENSAGYGSVEKLGVPLIECADYMETSAIGRAEWMLFYGRLFGREAEADSLFRVVETRYLQLCELAAEASSAPTVFCELRYGSAWYVPGGRSTTGRLLGDARGQYVFAADEHSGSVPLSFETVFDAAGEAEFWTFKYHRATDMTYADLSADYAGYAAFKAYRSRKVYGCNTAKVAFYEEAPFRPDYLLADYIQILHPELGDLGGLRYFSALR